MLDVTLWGISGWYLIAFILGLVGAAQYMGFINILPTTKKNAALVAVAGIAIGLFGGGYLSGLGVTEEAAPTAQPAQIFESSVTGTTHISDIDSASHVIRVDYQAENSTGAAGPYFESSDTDSLDTVVFDLTLKRVDLDADNAKIAQVTSSYDTWENSEETTGTVYQVPEVVNSSIDRDNIQLLPSGGSTAYEDTTTVVSAAGSMDVTVTVGVDATFRDQIDLYGSKSVYVNAPDATWEVRFHRIG